MRRSIDSAPHSRDVLDITAVLPGLSAVEVQEMPDDKLNQACSRVEAELSPFYTKQHRLLALIAAAQLELQEINPQIKRLEQQHHLLVNERLGRNSI